MVSVMVRWLFELTNIRELKQTTPETTTRTPRHKSLMSRTTAVQVRDKSLDYRTTVANDFYYIDTDEIPGFLLLLKNHIFPARCEHIIFIFHMREYRCRHGNEHD